MSPTVPSPHYPSENEYENENKLLNPSEMISFIGTIMTERIICDNTHANLNYGHHVDIILIVLFYYVVIKTKI